MAGNIILDCGREYLEDRENIMVQMEQEEVAELSARRIRGEKG